MKIIALAELLLIKYAEDLEDTSLGTPINAQKVRILKDKLILIYDKLTKDITKLPAFQELNRELSDDLYFQEFNRLIINLVNYVEINDLKHTFNYSIKLIERLNQLGNSIIRSGLPREQVLSFDAAIKSVQDTIWRESKRLLNIHDLRGIILHFPELKNILESVPIPTWDFGPMKSPAQKPIRQRFHRTKDLMKRLLQENEEEDKAKRKNK